MLGQLPWTAFALGGTKGMAAFGISGVPGALGVGGVGEGSRYPVHNVHIHIDTYTYKA